MDAADKAHVDEYRNRIFITYSGAGVLLAILVLYNVQDSMLSEVSSTMAAVFVSIIAVFTWTGGAIANAVYSIDDAATPFAHGRAVIKSLPAGLAAFAVLLAVVLLAMQIPAPRVMYVAGFGFGAWVRRLVKTRDQPG